MHLSVIIPAFNEEGRIAKTLTHALDYLARQQYQSEIIVVSDGSTDGTTDIVSKLQKENASLKLLDYATNMGKGYAVKQGVKLASGKWMLFMDADDSTTIEEIERLWPVSEREKIVFGARIDTAQTRVIQPLKRKIVSRLSNWLIRKALKTDIIDTQCGFKLFEMKIAKSIFDRLTIYRFGFDMEIVAIAKANKLNVAVVAVNWTNVVGSKVRALRDLKRSLVDLVVIKDNYQKGIYKLK